MPEPKSLIINSPYEVPNQHWQQARDGSLTQVTERRPADYSGITSVTRRLLEH